MERSRKSAMASIFGRQIHGAIDKTAEVRREICEGHGGHEKNFGGSQISVCAADGDLRLRAAPAAGGFSQVSGRRTFKEEGVVPCCRPIFLAK
jgi:hypothetical protein